MLNIVIPMAGAGSRFASSGYTHPKPLIPIHETPMIRAVIKNLTPKREHRFIFICQQKHITDYELDKKLKHWAPESIVIAINEITEGAACTVLKAKKYINNNAPLMIANCDQYIDTSIDNYLNNADNYDGFIMTMTADDPKWSFVALNEKNEVIEVAEKKVISNEATVGIYNFKNGLDFVRSAEESVCMNLRTNGEFYVAPIYNILIKNQKKIGSYNIGEENNGMYGLGIPSDLDNFIQHPLSQLFLREPA